MPNDILTPTGETGNNDYTKSKGRSNPFGMPEGAPTSNAPMGNLVEVEDLGDSEPKPRY